MASVTELVEEVLENLGQPGLPVGDELRTRVRRQVLRTYRVRLPEFIAGPFFSSIKTFSIGTNPAAAGDALGIYTWDSVLPELASVRSPVLSGPDELGYFTSFDDFYTDHDIDDLTAGTPHDVYVVGREFRIRPVPLLADGPWVITVLGNYYPPKPANDGVQLHIQLEDAIINGATLFEALSDGEDEIAARFKLLFEASVDHLGRQEQATSRSVPRRSDF